ncbi:hypothetical protein [Endozoicomonas sp. 4G]|uniref:hypothetical protein n=1 Tax=Endozoicomonas sp. 4G TaxID=2872754 RepID=UPI002078697D|nr:hypothetical protein [Endozoicomonas sp. 4G]
MKKLSPPPSQKNRPDSLSAMLFLILAGTFSLQTLADPTNPEDSLVVINNARSATGFCLGVLTGEKEVTTTAPCAQGGGFGSYAIYSSLEDLSHWQGAIQPDWPSRRNRQEAADENQIVKITLEQHPENKSIAKLSKQAHPIKTTPHWQCLALAGDWDDARWRWQMRSVTPLSASADIYPDIYIAPVNNHLTENMEGWYVHNTVAIFDQEGALVGFSYCPSAAYSTSSDKFRVYSIDYQSGQYRNHQDL